MPRLITFVFCGILFSGVSQMGKLENAFYANLSSLDYLSISKTEELNDGKFLVAALLPSNVTNSVNKKLLIRLNSNGTLDNSFTPPLFSKNQPGISSFGVNDFKVDDQGKIYVAGSFDHVNSIFNKGLVRLNPDGSVDTSFNANSIVYELLTVEIQPNNKILVGGNFTSFGSANTNSVLRLNTDGSIDHTFTSSFLGSSNSVKDIEYTHDDKIVLIGTFVSYGGVLRNNILRLNTDGTLDLGFNSGSGLNGPGDFIEEVSEGNYFAGGILNSYNDTLVGGCLILNSDGTIKRTFYNSELSNVTNIFNDFTIDSEGNYICSGQFDNYQYPYGGGSLHLIRFDSLGVLDTHFTNYVLDVGIVNSVFFLNTQNNLIVAGNISTHNGFAVNDVIKIKLYCSTVANITMDPASLSVQNYSYYANVPPNYAWISCSDSSLILGATSSSFNPTQNGQYTAIITDDYCIDTLNCVMFSSIGFDELSNEILNVIPNPSNGSFQIVGSTSGDFSLINDIGLKILKIRLEPGSIIHVNDIESGVYWLVSSESMSNIKPIKISIIN